MISTQALSLERSCSRSNLDLTKLQTSITQSSLSSPLFSHHPTPQKAPHNSIFCCCIFRPYLLYYSYHSRKPPNHKETTCVAQTSAFKSLRNSSATSSTESVADSSFMSVATSTSKAKSLTMFSASESATATSKNATSTRSMPF